jgi:hypothetical protein
MSNTITDYSNTIIYKITCKDQTITDVYVGHTVNFVQRKHAHKQSCVNTKCVNYKCKLYEVIRNNGGWDNWKMEIVDFFNCCNQFEARQKEQEYFLSLHATLNSIEPNPPPKPVPVKCKKIRKAFICDTSNKQISTENIKLHHCIICDFKCSKLGDWNRHILTTKHLAGNKSTQNISHIIQCNCGKMYKDRTGLWRHKKKCSPKTEHIVENTLTPHVNDVSVMPAFDMNLVLELLKQNQEFKDLLLEQNKQIIDQHQIVMEQNKNIIEIVNKIT